MKTHVPLILIASALLGLATSAATHARDGRGESNTADPLHRMIDDSRKPASDDSSDTAVDRFKALLACKDKTQGTGSDQAAGQAFGDCAHPFFSPAVPTKALESYLGWLLKDGDSVQGVSECSQAETEAHKAKYNADDVICFTFTPDGGQSVSGKAYYKRESGALMLTAIKY